MRHNIPQFVSILFLTFILAGCSSTEQDNVIRMGVTTAPSNLDPRFATDAISSRINRLLYRRLVEFDPSGMPIPSIANWVQITPTHYRFNLLQEGRTFHNGRRLTAADVKATFDSILDPKVGSPHRSTVDVIQHIEINGEDQVEFHLKKPDSLFPGYLNIGILPSDLMQKGHGFSTMPVGSGPFMFDDWPQEGIPRLVRLHDKQKLEFVPVADPTVRILKLLRGEIDLVQNDLPPELLAYLKEKEEVSITRSSGSNFSYLGFNLQDQFTGQPNIRRAIAHAIDRDSIIKFFLKGSARPAQAMLPPSHWAGAKELQGYRFDQDTARKLLKKSGFNQQNPLTLVYKTSTDPFRIRLATLIQNQLAQVGVELEIQSHDWGTFYGDVKNGRFQLYSLAWVGVKTPDIFRYVFHSESAPPNGANRGRYTSKEVDQIITSAEATRDFTGKAMHYHNLQKRLLADLPYIPLWYEDHISISSKLISGYKLATDGNYDGLEKVVKDRM